MMFDGGEGAIDVGFKTQDAEGSLTQVKGYELAQILYDDFALDDIESAGWQMWHLQMKGLVDSALQFLLVAQKVLKNGFIDV